MFEKTQIMDVTLRDGSYAVNFQFSEYETEKICLELSSSGIKYIEIGHGMGINAGEATNLQAMCSDVEYLQAAQRGSLDTKFGMFCIPTYAKLSTLEAMKKYGASFIRVGSNANDVESTAKYIKAAKKSGFEVMANYMKSYVVSPEEFAENVKKSESYGADVIYIVDSAGSMNHSDIEKYFDAVKKVSNIQVGFHGHNNLGLAVSNSLYAIELGFDFVDTSVLGMGRSAGNAATELLIGNMIKSEHINTYNLKRILDCAEKYVKPLWKHTSNALDLYCGIAEFHTSYMKYIHKYAIKYRINPLDLIVAYAQYDKVNLNEKKLNEIASSLEKDENCIITDYGFNDYIGNEQIY